MWRQRGAFAPAGRCIFSEAVEVSKGAPTNCLPRGSAPTFGQVFDKPPQPAAR